MIYTTKPNGRFDEANIQPAQVHMLSTCISSLHIFISQIPSHKEKGTHKLHTCHLTHVDFTDRTSHKERGTHKFHWHHHRTREGHKNFSDIITDRERDTQISHTPSQNERGTHKFHWHYHRTREGHTKLAGTTTWKERRTQRTSQILSHKGRGMHETHS